MTINNLAARCRCCGETGRLQDLGFIGEVAPFFLRRVAGMRLGASLSASRWKRTVQRIVQAAVGLLARVYKPTALVEIQICDSCLFVQTKLPFYEDAINRLYADYREESYNRERIAYEPGYARIAPDVGHSQTELHTRLSGSGKFLKAHIPATEDFTILDFGGSDGKFMPQLNGRKYVFEISMVEPVAGVTRIHSETELGTYSLVQLAHVVEHVVEPLALVKHVATKVADGGYLYIETPEEASDADRPLLRAGELRILIHEHINRFCVQSVTRLVESAGLRLVAIEAEPVDVGWATSVHIRALGQKC
ncbi:MAG TPA: class I SAM-dependent methyltransferase [Acidobacteriaceae bacterium]|nr:class I SAM-dependent methyltransferase [Acidobacteriaceae bacterium]